MKILLLNPPWYRLQETSLIHYPGGLAYIAGALENAGYESIIWNSDYDPNIRPVIGGTNILDTEELTRKYNLYKKNLDDLSLPIWQEIKSKIKEFNPDIVGISVYSATYKSALNVTKIIKSINSYIITILGGIHPTINPEEVASQKDVDFVVYGEGEITIQELIKVINSDKRNFSSIKGIVFKNNGNVIKTEKREFIQNLDTLPFPARHRIYNFEKYPPTTFQAIYGSRGCPFKCIFCGSFNLWGYKIRIRSAENIVKEIEETNQKYKTRYFYICDDIFFINRNRAITFCKLLIEKKLNILWSAQTRAEILDDELLSLMKKSGGQHVAIGIEVGDEKIRKLIKKENTNDQIREAVQKIKKHGLTVVGFFMFGFPWETKENIEKTVNFLKKINPTFAFPYIVTPSPGTELFSIAHQMGLINPASQFEDFYHESPEMGLSINIPKQERKEIIDKTLKEFAIHNKKHFLKDILKRPKFYCTLIHDFEILKNPKFILGYITDLFKKHKKC